MKMNADTPTYDLLLGAIALITDVDMSAIREDTDLVNELAIDSLDMVDILFEVAQAIGKKIAFAEWVQNSVTEGADSLFIARNLCTKIDALRRATADSAASNGLTAYS